MTLSSHGPPWVQTDGAAEALNPPVATPPWMQTGGVSTLDSGAYGRTVAALRISDISEAQRRCVIDLITQARLNGHALDDLDPMAPQDVRLTAFGAILRTAIERGDLPGVRIADSDTLQRLYDATIGWGDAVQRLLDDPSITEVKIIGVTAVGVSARGRTIIPHAYASTEEPMRRVQALAQVNGIAWDQRNPSITIPLGHKTRLHATRDPLVRPGDLLLVFRRGRRHPWTLHDLVQRGAMDALTAETLERLAHAGASIIISGPQDSGKTTLLECLANALSRDRHLILVEDATDEFQLKPPLVTRLQVHGRSGEALPIGYAEVVRETLRMTPDVLVPGEIRGAEAAAVLQMCESGRPTMTTVHAPSPAAAIRRLARLASAPGAASAGFTYATALQTLADSFHVVIQMRSSPRLGRRVVTHVMALDSGAAIEDVRLIPLITAHVDESQIENPIQWRHAGTDWRTTLDAAPPRVQELLTHAMSATSGYQAQSADARTDYDRLITQALHALHTMHTPHAALESLNHAYAVAPDRTDVWHALEQASGLFPEHFQQIVMDVQTLLQHARAALNQLDDATAQRLLDQIGRRVEHVFLAQQLPTWNEVRQRLEDMRAQAQHARQALADAWALASQQRRYADAMQALAQASVRDLPHQIAHEVIRARQAVLDAWERTLTPDRTDERRAVERYRIINRADHQWLAALTGNEPSGDRADHALPIADHTLRLDAAPSDAPAARTHDQSGDEGPGPAEEAPELPIVMPIRTDSSGDVGATWRNLRDALASHARRLPHDTARSGGANGP